MQVRKSKIGRFFFFIGLISLVVFFAMDQAKNPNYAYFCVGVIVVFFGGFLMLRGHKPPEESMRFRTLRKWREQQRERKAERRKKPWEGDNSR
jgi:hypothetical protein